MGACVFRATAKDANGIKQKFRLLELYLTKVYSEQKGMGDEERVLGNEDDKSEQ